jgi:hypothetical protein
MKKLHKAEQAAKTLRMKYVMSVGGSLDNVSLPSIYSANTPNTHTQMSESMSMPSFGSMPASQSQERRRASKLKFAGYDSNADDGASHTTEITFEQIQVIKEHSAVCFLSVI